VHDLWSGNDQGSSHSWLLSQLAIAIRTRDAPCLVAILLVAQHGCENGDGNSFDSSGSSNSSGHNGSNATIDPPTVLLLRVLKEVRNHRTKYCSLSNAPDFKAHFINF